jgi:type IV pilus assembly protein PilV
MQLKFQARGFSLVEVMVALVVTTVGLLGLAKLESVSLSSTGVASMRSIAAIEASSMAAAMHANGGYWANGFAATSYTITSSTTTYQGNSCTSPGSGSCNAQQQAYYDLTLWQASLNQMLPQYLATINCSPPPLYPITCTIQLQWVENAVAANSQQTQMSGLTPNTYQLFVQP